MQDTGKWIVGGLVSLLGIIGLFAASGAHDPQMHYAGLIFFIAAVVFIFGLIGTYGGRRRRQG